MAEETFQQLDHFLNSGDRAGGLDFLIEHFRAAKEFRLFFEAKLMRIRLNLALPLIQDVGTPQVPPEKRADYDNAMIAAAKETGNLALENGDIVRAWPYFRAIGEQGTVAEAIDRLNAATCGEQVIGIAFQEGVHPAKGLEMILEQNGMCRAITTFGMYPVEKGRAECIGLLVRRLHGEIVERMVRTIESVEGNRLQTANIIELMAGRDWLFGEYDYYVDTSHLQSLLPYSLETTDPETLQFYLELCEYGKHLSPMFQTAGQPPFEQPYIDYGEYVRALMGDDIDTRLAHFRKKVQDCVPEEMGTGPAQVFVNLAVRLDRFEEALQVATEYLSDDDPAELACPSILQLCVMAKDYDRLTELARLRGDLLSYVGASAR